MFCYCWETNENHNPIFDPEHDHCLNCNLCSTVLTNEEKARLGWVNVLGKYRLRILDLGDPRIGVSVHGTAVVLNIDGRFRRIARRSGRIIKYLRKAHAELKKYPEV